MASADCVSSAGVWSYATPIKHGTGDCATYVGLNSACTRVAWGGSRSPKKTVDWMPRADEVWIDSSTGRPTRRFYQFIAEVEKRLGGIQGATIPQVQTTVTQTQATVTATVNYATQVSQYAQGVAASTEATIQVLQDSGTAGSESIPEVPALPPNPKRDFASDAAP